MGELDLKKHIKISDYLSDDTYGKILKHLPDEVRNRAIREIIVEHENFVEELLQDSHRK